VGIGTAYHFKPDPGFCKGMAQGLRRGKNLRAGVVVYAWKDVRRTRRNLDSVSDREARNFQRGVEIARPVIQSGKKVAMKVDHPFAVLENGGL
jgi:hypothetical protein